MANKKASGAGASVAKKIGIIAAVSVVAVGGVVGFAYKDSIADWINPPCEHECEEGTETVLESTCTQEGQKKYVCKICGENVVVVLPKAEHTEEVVAAVDATCSSEGLTEGKKCADCGEVLIAQEATEKLEHTVEVIPGVAATCYSTGLTSGQRCTECGEILLEQAVLEKTDSHNVELMAAVPATCATTGLTAGQKCSDCGEIILEQKVVEKLSHNVEVLPAVSSTCTATGLTAGQKCADCGEVIVAQSIVEMLPHSEKIISSISPTCDEEGKTVYECSVCGTTREQVLPALGHTEVNVAMVAATCTEEGTSAGKKCSVCGDRLSGFDVIPATGHVGFNGNEFYSTCYACDYIDVSKYYSLSEDQYLESMPLYQYTSMQRDQILEFKDRSQSVQIKLYYAYPEESVVKQTFYELYYDKLVLTDTNRCVEFEDAVRFFEDDGKYYVRLPDQNDLELREVFKTLTVNVTGVPTYKSIYKTSVVSYDRTFTHTWDIPDSEHVEVVDGALCFKGTGEVSMLSTTRYATTYSNFIMRFKVEDLVANRGAFQLGFGHKIFLPDGTKYTPSLTDSAFIQFNHDRIVVQDVNGNMYDTSWVNGDEWTIMYVDGHLSVFCENGVVYEDLVLESNNGGFLLLHAEEDCAVKITDFGVLN